MASAAQAKIELSDTYFVMKTVIKNVAMSIGAAIGKPTRDIPNVVSIPLPPLNLR